MSNDPIDPLEMPDAPPARMTPVQVVGFLCWRAGLLLIGGYGLYRAARLVWTYADLPVQLEVGAGIATAGALLVAGSLVAERAIDAKAEREAA